MTDEEAFFEVWFQLDRQKRYAKLYPGETMPADWSTGFRGSMLAGWLARSTTHVTYAKPSPPLAPPDCTCPRHRVPMILHVVTCPMRARSPMFLDSARLAEMRKELEQDPSNDSQHCNDLDELLTMCGYPPPAPIERTEKRPPRDVDFNRDPDGDPLV